MKRFSMSLLLLTIISLCLGCSFVGQREYYCDASQVDRVSIIQLDAYIKEELRFEFTVLAEVEDPAAFVERLNSIEQSAPFFGDPPVMNPGYTVIRIDYRNGDYDLIYYCTQLLHRSGTNQTPTFYYSKEAFDELIHAALAT